MIDTVGDGRNDLDVVFDMVRAVWPMSDMRWKCPIKPKLLKKRPIPNANGKSVSGGEPVGEGNTSRAAVSGRAFFSSMCQWECHSRCGTPPEPVLPTTVNSDAQAADYMSAWQTLLPLNGSECQAAGIHVDERERGIMVNLTMPGAASPTVCPVKTNLAVMALASRQFLHI